MRLRIVMRRVSATKRLSSPGKTCYAIGAGLLLGGLVLVAFCGLSLLVGRRLPAPIAEELIAASVSNWLGVAAGAVLLLCGAVLAIIADFKATHAAWPPAATHSARRSPSPRLAQSRQHGGIQQQADGVNVHRRIPVPRVPVKEI
jgi:hypothetical protein